MTRARRTFVCSECQGDFPAPAGRCPRCGAWNSIVEAPQAHGGETRPSRLADAARVIPLQGTDDDVSARLRIGIDELDRVLGGGLVRGSLVLAGGEPGIGKSTLMLQVAAALAAQGETVAYICGEESPGQVRLRASRLGISGERVSLIPETNLEAALSAALGINASVVVIDSVQTVYADAVESRPGGTLQLAEVGARLVAWAKSHEITTLVTGHVTKSGEIAGPRLLEHLVDVVLYFEAAQGGLRVLRAAKNRFGASDEVGVFEMTGQGLTSVLNPSKAFTSDAAESPASGCAVTAVLEGSRPLAVEVQALAVPSSLAVPRRVAHGIDISRLHVLLAVLGRRAGVFAGTFDVIVSASGGLRLRDPAIDLAIIAALASAVADRPLPARTAFLGEVSLSGALRPLSQPARRLSELSRSGFARCIAPISTASADGVEVSGVRSVREALRSAGL